MQGNPGATGGCDNAEHMSNSLSHDLPDGRHAGHPVVRDSLKS